MDWLREMESERGVYRVMSSREAQLLVGECSSQEEGGMRGRGTCPILIPKLTERIKEILRRRLPFSYYCTRSVFIYIRTVRSIKSKRHHIGSIPPSPTALEKKKKKKKKAISFFFSLSLISYFIARATEHKQLGLSVSPLAVARISSRQNRNKKKKLDHHRRKSSCTESMIDIPPPIMYLLQGIIYQWEKGKKPLDGQRRKKKKIPSQRCYNTFTSSSTCEMRLFWVFFFKQFIFVVVV